MILVKTPLRISFIGGSTDIENFYSRFLGRCISTTIDKYIYIAINEKFGGDVRVSYSHTENVPTSKEVKHTRVKAIMEKLGIEKGVEIVSISDLPSEGTGLASSSAFTVGLLQGLHDYIGAETGGRYLAEEACEVEIDILKEPVGKQDQYAVAYGGMNYMEFSKSEVNIRSLSYHSDFEDYLMFFYSSKTRSASSILKEQSQNSEANFEALKKVSDMVPKFAERLRFGDFKELGKLLHEAWLIKRGLSKGITDDEIDGMYELARLHGAWGGKIVGAGGGGFLMLMVPPDKQDMVRSAISWKEVKFKFSNKGSEIVYNTTK